MGTYTQLTDHDVCLETIYHIIFTIGRVKFLISPTYSYGGATALRAWVTHLPLMEHSVLMVKVVMKSVVIISIQHI